MSSFPEVESQDVYVYAYGPNPHAPHLEPGYVDSSYGSVRPRPLPAPADVSTQPLYVPGELDTSSMHTGTGSQSLTQSESYPRPGAHIDYTSSEASTNNDDPSLTQSSVSIQHMLAEVPIPAVDPNQDAHSVANDVSDSVDGLAVRAVLEESAVMEGIGVLREGNMRQAVSIPHHLGRPPQIDLSLLGSAFVPIPPFTAITRNAPLPQSSGILTPVSEAHDSDEAGPTRTLQRPTSKGQASSAPSTPRAQSRPNPELIEPGPSPRPPRAQSVSAAPLVIRTLRSHRRPQQNEAIPETPAPSSSPRAPSSSNPRQIAIETHKFLPKKGEKGPSPVPLSRESSFGMPSPKTKYLDARAKREGTAEPQKKKGKRERNDVPQGGPSEPIDARANKRQRRNDSASSPSKPSDQNDPVQSTSSSSLQMSSQQGVPSTIRTHTTSTDTSGRVREAFGDVQGAQPLPQSSGRDSFELPPTLSDPSQDADSVVRVLVPGSVSNPTEQSHSSSDPKPSTLNSSHAHRSTQDGGRSSEQPEAGSSNQVLEARQGVGSSGGVVNLEQAGKTGSSARADHSDNGRIDYPVTPNKARMATKVYSSAKKRGAQRTEEEEELAESPVQLRPSKRKVASRVDSAGLPGSPSRTRAAKRQRGATADASDSAAHPAKRPKTDSKSLSRGKARALDDLESDANAAEDEIEASTTQAVSRFSPYSRVLALWAPNKCYYPGTVIGRIGSGRNAGKYSIIFDDAHDAIVALNNIRAALLRKGDTVATNSSKDFGKVVDTGFTMLDKATPVHVHWVQSESDRAILGEELCVPNSAVSEWDDRKLEANQILPVAMVKQEPGEYTSKSTTDTRNSAKPAYSRASVAAASGSRRTAQHQFKGHAFVITWSTGQPGEACQPGDRDKDGLVRSIQISGGLVVDEFSDYFSVQDARIQWKGGNNITAIWCISNRVCTTPKYLLALALGVPCLSYKFIQDVLEDRATVSNWSPYLLAAGRSEYLATECSQRVDWNWGRKTHEGRQLLTDLISSPAICRPLRDKRFLVVSSRKQAQFFKNSLPQVLWAMGARQVNKVNSVSPDQEFDEYDYLFWPDDDNMAISLAKSKHAKVVGPAWIKQCVISGFLVPVPGSS